MSNLSHKVANNMLEFLLDPTVIPIKTRLYFGPGENLQNEELEKAREDAQKAYKDQKNNSDFYPSRNRKQTLKEATVMDRKTMIASLDVLSQNFAEDDPIGTDLRTMALAVSKMEEPEFNYHLAAETFKCPTCGTKVLKQTGYCVKCKKKVKPGAEKKAADDVCPDCGQAGCKCPKKAAEETCPDCGKAECTCPKKEAAETFKCPTCGTKVLKQTGFCVKCKKKVKKASDDVPEDKEPDNDKDDEKKATLLDKTASDAIHLAVVRGLVAEVYGDDPEPEPEAEPEEEPKKEEAPAAPAKAPAPAPTPEEPSLEPVEPEKKPEEDVPQKAAVKAPEVPEPEKKKEKDAGQNSPHPQGEKKEKDSAAAPEQTSPEPEKKDDEKQKDAAKPAPDAEKDEKKEPVDDSMLSASQVFNNVELTAPMMTEDDIGVLSADEQARLNSVMGSVLLSADEKTKIEGLLR